MQQPEPACGSLHPNASPALAVFAFLIGRWNCEAKVKLDDGRWQSFPVSWFGRYILDGYAIADEYRMTDADGRLIVLGENFRTYDPGRQHWTLKWLNALAGTWTDLGPEELGGVQWDGTSISYLLVEPMAAHAYTRATYTNISSMHFTWRGEKSNDGKSWSEFMVVEAERAPD